jgi:nucleotide-binding universal stress UspA family protein
MCEESKGSAMFDPILVPLDGSQLAECVLPQVIAIGQAFNAKIVLLHVMGKNPSDASTQFINPLNWQINVSIKNPLSAFGSTLPSGQSNGNAA